MNSPLIVHRLYIDYRLDYSSYIFMLMYTAIWYNKYFLVI